jgi:hypothetical protein
MASIVAPGLQLTQPRGRQEGPGSRRPVIDDTGTRVDCYGGPMLVATLIAMCLAGAPLSFEDGEFLGFTEDGSAIAWTSTVDNRAVSPPKRLTTATVRHLVRATEDTWLLEERPFGDAKAAPTPGPDLGTWEAWKKAHPLVKPTAADGVTVSMRVNGKGATTWGGDGKAAKVELTTSARGVKRTEASMLATYLGKKLRRTTGSVVVDPKGRRAVFVLSTEAGGGEAASAELVIVPIGPTAEVFVGQGVDVTEKARLVENAGVAVTGFTQSPTPDSGITVIGDASTFAAAEQLARALGGKAVRGRVDRRLSDLQVTFDAKPVR